MTMIRLLALVSSLSLLLACREQPSAPSGAGNANNAGETPGLQTFQVKGVVKKPNPEEKRISIQHEEIPGYMPAMTMPFNVKDTAPIKDLQPGDQIEFRLSVTEDESWIDNIRKTGTAPAAAAPPERPSVRLAREVEPLAEGEMMPDYVFTNDVRQVIRLSDFKGKALAFTFIFTRCPMPEFCPLMQRNFLAAYKQLKNDPNAPRNWHLLSISFDPHFDTPEVLKNYGALYPHDRADWDFATGAMIDIDAITDQFEVGVTKQGSNWDHKLRTVVIDANGRIQKIFIANAWTPSELVEEIVKAAKAAPQEQAAKN